MNSNINSTTWATIHGLVGITLFTLLLVARPVFAGAGGDPCTLGGNECVAVEYCYTGDGNCAFGTPGVCLPRPLLCTDEVIEPVCGCNGFIYQSACFAAQDGMTMLGDALTCSDNCPDSGGFVSLPPDDTVDARQPFPPAGGTLQGIGQTGEEITIIFNSGAAGASYACFSLCETKKEPYSANAITGVYDQGGGVYLLTLARAITPNASTTITYKLDGASTTFYAHPSNANGDELANAVDVLFIVDLLNGVAIPPHGVYSQDIDHSGVFNAADILRIVDLLNGAGSYNSQLFTKVPGNICPSYCQSNDGCPAGQYCTPLFGEGCDLSLGICIEKPFSCTNISQPVCGCDLMTYDNDCLAAQAGVNVIFDAACDAICETGDPGACQEGQFCYTNQVGLCGDGEVGYCHFKPNLCSQVWVPICGCDNITYGNKCKAVKQGVNFLYNGMCDSCYQTCGGQSPGGCYCDNVCCLFGDCCNDYGQWCDGCD